MDKYNVGPNASSTTRAAHSGVKTHHVYQRIPAPGAWAGPEQWLLVDMELHEHDLVFVAWLTP